MGFQDYVFLKDVKVEFKENEDKNGFFLCFWFFLNDASTLPSIILQQEYPEVTSHVPFLLLDEEKRMLLFPLQVSSIARLTHWRNFKYATSLSEFPMKRWVHIGCEVRHDLLRLYLDGEIVGEEAFTSSINKNLESDSSGISLTCISGKDSQLDGYALGAELLPIVSSIKGHYVKDPPVQLCIDCSSASEIEEDTYGVWSIISGKVIKIHHETSGKYPRELEKTNS